MTATSASRLLLPNSRKALRNSLTVTFNRDSTVSKPADLNMPATAAASFAGFWSRATFLYAELPMTSATRLSAKALTPVVARMAAAKTNERNEITARISPCDRIVGTTPSEQVDFALADSLVMWRTSSTLNARSGEPLLAISGRARHGGADGTGRRTGIPEVST